MLGVLPVFCEHLSIVSKDCMEMILIARKANSPQVMQTLSCVPLVLGQLSEKKYLSYLPV